MKTVKVSADLIALLAETCDEIMKQDGGVHKRDWLAQVTTSKESSAAGGPIALRNDHDWKVAFIVWYFGRPNIVTKLPRERS